jgi:ABC-type nitrate/sulfonate/bicarbonate transport system ATPase subunit
MLKIENLHKKYGGLEVHKDFSFTAPEGKMTAIVGPSGIGKTTLLRCIAGLEEFEGEITAEGKLSYMFQEDRLMPWLSIEENLLLPLKLEGREVSADDTSRMRLMAQFFNVEQHLGKSIDKVSGGEKQRLLLIRALIVEPNILLLDEPFKSLDENLYTQLYKKVRHYCMEKHITVLLVTHQSILAKSCDYTLELL